MYALLLAGGKGTRLWPLSKADTPKQLLSPLGETKSLLENTIDRIVGQGFKNSNIHLVTSQEQVEILSPVWNDLGDIVAEPNARNTGSAVLLATKYLMANGCRASDSIFIFPTDHYITNFSLDTSIDLSDEILCYRVVPTRVETGYGYIKTIGSDMLRKVDSFKEKPSMEVAQKWYDAWDNNSNDEKYFWNSGIYGFTINSLSSVLKKTNLELFNLWMDLSYQELLSHYEHLPTIPFDKMIAEKADNLYSLPLPADTWRDIGTWQSIYEALQQNEQENIHLGKGTLIVEAVNECLVSSDKVFNIACAGVDNLAIIIKDNNILIVDKKSPQAMVELIKTIQSTHNDIIS